MKQKLIKIAISICTASMLMISMHANARTFLSGEAELSYVKFDAKTDNPLGGTQSKFTGDSFAQKYSAAWTATNLFYRTQPQYYNISLGYDWLSFETKTSDGSADSSLKETFGKFRYTGEGGYNPVNIPIRLRVYANDAQPITLKRSLGQYGLIDDQLVATIEGRGSSEGYGATFTFEPSLASSTSWRSLPRLHLDYRESFNKSLGGSSYYYDNATKELAVAGLSKENNWVHFRTINFKDNVDKNNNFEQQQLQIGLVAPGGRRLWSSLTNWIEVSADGQFTNKRASESYEEYDVNFMALATRRTWNVRTFMNYNRKMNKDNNLSDSYLTETAIIPIYVKGVYGPATDWYMQVSATRGTQVEYSPSVKKEASYSNTVTVGANTFKRSDFTLSPSLSVTTSKMFGGTDSLSFNAAVESTSTSRYSKKAGLAARAEFHFIDDGYNNSASKSWYNSLILSASYRPDRKFVYTFKESVETGEGAPPVPIPGYNGTKAYMKTATSASIAWTPNNAFTSALEASYELRKNEDNASTNEALLAHRLSYDKKETSFRVDTKFINKDIYTASYRELANTGTFNYRPDRYSDAMLRYTYNKTDYKVYGSSKMELIQRYSYNFFTRAGVIRNFASISQELGYASEEGSTLGKRSNQYLRLSGRYSPIGRLALYGSVKYETADQRSVTAYYNAGLNADFKLLSTSLDYALAKRDSDNRIEKRLNATVKRTF